MEHVKSKPWLAMELVMMKTITCVGTHACTQLLHAMGPVLLQCLNATACAMELSSMHVAGSVSQIYL